MLAELKLDDHDDCTTWRNTVKPFLKHKLYPLFYQPLIPLIKRNEEDGIVRSSVDDLYQLALDKLNEKWNISSKSFHLSDCSEAEGSQDEDMGSSDEDAMEDGMSSDGSLDEEPSFIRCCKLHLQNWRNVALRELTDVQF